MQSSIQMLFINFIIVESCSARLRITISMDLVTSFSLMDWFMFVSYSIWFLLGINILIFGSMIPVIHYFFYCYFKLKTLYISILLVLSLASVIGTSSATCSQPHCRPFKAILFIALGLYGRNRKSFWKSSQLIL